MVTLNGKTSSFKALSYYDAEQKILFFRKNSGWSRKENQANEAPDVQTLLKINESVLQNSAFAKTEFCFVFGKFSHRLTQIEGNN